MMRTKRITSIVAILCLFLMLFCSAFSTVSRAEAVFGDVNADGFADMKDVLSYRRYLAHMQGAATDLDGDGACTMKDVLFLRQYLVGCINANGEKTGETIPVRTSATTTTTKAPVKTEMRAVWVAYYEVEAVLKSTAAATKTAIDTLMANIASYGANAVIWHVRAYSEAYYNSKYFPVDPTVSPLLKAGFDPFDYAVKSAHSHGLELHAWINPYRIGSTLDRAKCSDTFLFNGKYYYSPASSTVRTLVTNGAKEIVQNYAVDGIHLDDYFYPEGISTSAQTFDIGYTSSAGSLANWRRKQVSTLIKNMYTELHKIKSSISFGVSPGGTIAKDRDNMYADVETWISTAGYIDYICPQVYFGMEHATAAFETRVSQWCAVPRAKGVKMYIGLAVYKAGLLSDAYAGTGKTEWATHSDILAREVKSLRKRSDVQGFMLFSYRYMNLSAFNSAENDVSIAKKEIANLIAEMKK